MSRPKGSIIGARPTWTTTATSGIWTLRQAEEMQADGKWPRGPVAPTSLAGTGGDQQVALTWVAPATTHGTITDYVVEYTPAAGSPTVVATGSTAASYTLTGLTNDTEYTFRVAGVNHTRGDWSSSVAVTPSAGFSPSSITGLKLWLDASDSSSLYDATSGGSLVAADGAVARWEDKSGGSNHFTQATSGSRPVRKTSQHNSLDAVRFTNQFMEGFTASTVFSGATSATCFAVMRVDTSPGVLLFNIGSASDNWTPFNGNGRVYDDFASNARRDTGWNMSLGTLHLLTFESASNWRLLVNGAQQYSAAGNTVAFGSSAALLGRNGGEYPSNAAAQDICEVLLYSSALSTGDREAVESYLMTKWGIT